jgi:uncharacterized protein
MRFLVCLCAFALPFVVGAQEPPRSPAPLVFFDIAGDDSATQRKFYAAIFAWDIDERGNFQTSTVSPLPGLMRQEPTETIVYIGVRDVTETLQQVEENGGSVVYPRFEVPGVVILGMFRDPAGNRVGLVELDENDTPIIP